MIEGAIAITVYLFVVLIIVKAVRFATSCDPDLELAEALRKKHEREIPAEGEGHAKN